MSKETFSSVLEITFESQSQDLCALAKLCSDAAMLSSIRSTKPGMYTFRFFKKVYKYFNIRLYVCIQKKKKTFTFRGFLFSINHRAKNMQQHLTHV